MLAIQVVLFELVDRLYPDNHLDAHTHVKELSALVLAAEH